MSALERLSGTLRDLVSGSSGSPETPPQSSEQKLVLGRRANDLILVREALSSWEKWHRQKVGCFGALEGHLVGRESV